MNGKNNLIKIIKANPMVVLAPAIIITALVIYTAIFIPMTKDIKARYTECRNFENEVTNARNVIDYAKVIGKSYGGRILISEKEASTGLDELTECARNLGINFISVKPQNTVSKEGAPYKMMPIELELEANDKQFIDFLGSIDELKKAIITVNSFDITPVPGDRTRLHAKMAINVYLSAKEGYPDES